MGTNEIFGLKSIKEYQKKGMGEIFGFYLRSAWYFDQWYEKLILVGLGILGMWKLLGFF